LASRSLVAAAGVVTCWKVPAGPVKVPACRRLSSRRAWGRVTPAVVSVMRMSSRASLQSRTWARMRSSSRWQTGRLHLRGAGAQLLPDDVVVVALPQVRRFWALEEPRSVTQTICGRSSREPSPVLPRFPALSPARTQEERESPWRMQQPRGPRSTQK
jgi:hypothetical protein